MPLCSKSQRTQLWLTILTICVANAGADILVFSASDKHQIEEEFRDVPARFGGMIPPEGIKVRSSKLFLKNPVEFREDFQRFSFCFLRVWWLMLNRRQRVML